MTTSTIKIRQFNPEIIERRRLSGYAPTIVVIGRRGSGKSTLISDLMWFIRKIPMVLVMSGTEEGNGFYSKYVHRLCIQNHYNKDIVNNLIKKQKERARICKREGIDMKSKPEYGVGLLLDDLGYDKKILTQEDITFLYMNSRHFGITFIVSLQYMMGLSPSLRNNIDFVFCLKDNIKANHKKLHDHFFGIFPKLEQFQKVFSECTNDYECLVLNNTVKSDKIEDFVSFYKATPNREYKIGSRELWNYFDSRYYENDEDEDDNSNRSKSSIIVKKLPAPRIVD